MRTSRLSDPLSLTHSDILRLGTATSSETASDVDSFIFNVIVAP